MNPNEHQLQYPWGDVQPEPGKAQAVADGVKWIRMPLPFALDHINLWLLRDELNGRQGWTIVDCGIARDEVKALWERVFEQELDGLPVLRVLVTHMHPDHVGLAHWLCERWNAELWMTMTDFMVASLWSSRRAATAWPRRPVGGGPFRAPRTGRPGFAGTDPPARQLLSRPGAGHADALHAHPAR